MSGPSKINQVIRIQGRETDWLDRYPWRTEGDRRAKVLEYLAQCRQGELGARQHECQSCGTDYVTLNACHDRHCPSCAHQARFLWHRKVLSWGLDCDYLHIVLTLPHLINDLVMANQAALLRLLFGSARESLLKAIGQWYGCTPGLIMVLHTWGQRLNPHYHVHIVCTAGGLPLAGSDRPGQWIPIDQDQMEASQEALAGLFKQRFMRGVEKDLGNHDLHLPGVLTDPQTLERMMGRLYEQSWVAHVGATPKKYRDQGDRQRALAYIGKYIAGTAIGDGRIIAITDQEVTFKAFDYRTGKSLVITFTHEQFVDAFADHILPRRMRRFRMAGLFAPVGRDARLEVCRAAIAQAHRQRDAGLHDDLEDNPLCSGEAFEEEEEDEDEESYVPCPNCGERTTRMGTYEGPQACQLLELAAAVWALLQSGAELTIRGALRQVFRDYQVKRGGLPRELLMEYVSRDAPWRFVSAIIGQRLREQFQAQQRAQQQRGPPKAAA